jgi:hypothetical protein
MIDPRIFIGSSIDFKGMFFIYPPKVKDIINNSNYNIFSSIFMTSQEDIEDMIAKDGNFKGKIPTPLEYMLSLAYSNPTFRETIKKGFFFYTHETVDFVFEEKAILIGADINLAVAKSVKDVKLLNEENYFDFQNCIREVNGIDRIEPPDPNLHPKIKYMRAKARLRDKVKAKKKGMTLSATLASICCMNFGLNPLNIGEITYAAIPLLIRYYQEKDKYETDVRSL